MENFWTLIILKTNWLAAWFIFELIGLRAVSEPQVFKNVSLQIMMSDQTFTFLCKFHKKLHHIQVCNVRYELPKWKRKRYSFIASSFRFHFGNLSEEEADLHLNRSVAADAFYLKSILPFISTTAWRAKIFSLFPKCLCSGSQLFTISSFLIVNLAWHLLIW